MNKESQSKIHQVEELIAQAKSELKTWANQISKHHKALKELTNQLNSLKSQLKMNQNNQTNSPTQSSRKSNSN